MREIEIKNLPIELAKFLKYAGLAESGGQAKQLILGGDVQVNGSIVAQKSLKIHDGDEITVAGKSIRICSQRE